MDIELLNFTLAAGQVVRFERAGRYIEVIDAPYNIASISLTGDDGQQGAFVRNCLSGIYAEVSFKGVELTNGSTAQTVQILITDGRGGSRRQPGVVQVVDSERSKVLGGVAFRSGQVQAGGGAGSARCQIFNPAGSGKLVFVNGVSISVSANDDYGVHTTTTQAPNVNGSALAMDVTGAAASVLCRSDNTATAYLNIRSLHSGTLLANSERELIFRRPVLLRAGYGLTVFANALPTNVRANFDIEEIAG